MSNFTVSDKLRRNYDEYYDGPSHWRELGAIDKVANIRNLCESIPHKSVLEIGAGDGSILAKLSDESFADQYHAIDISKSAIETVRARSIPGLVDISVFDGFTVPYENDRFDLVIMSHVVEHLEYPRALIREAARVAKFLFVEVPLELTWRLPANYVWDKTGHINYYSNKTIRHLLQTTDLEVIDELVSNSSRASYELRLGKKGVISHGIKEALLRVSPSLATSLYTYNGSLLCRRQG